jgi:hypothetical protein
MGQGVGERVSGVRAAIVKYAAAGYRRRDIADMVGVSAEELRRHLVAVGIVEEYPSVTARRVRRSRKSACGRSLAHNGPERFEEAVYE